ncbi:MAG: integrase [Alphaproteobacteria bacterium]
MMIAEVYEAFKDAGISDEKSRLAAEALTNESLATKAGISRVESELRLIKWMLGIVIAAVVLPLIRDLLL